MSQADFAFISFGQTAYELAALKVPSLYFSINKDHEDSAQLFVQERLGKSMGIFFKHNESFIDHFYEFLDHFINKNKNNMKKNIPFGLNNISLPILSFAK